MVVTTGGPHARDRTADPMHQAWVDAVPLPAALLDDQGRLRAINDGWKAAARPGAMLDPQDRVGLDYLHALRDNKGFEREAGRALADALEPVLHGVDEHMEHSYRLEQDDRRLWVAQASRVVLSDEILVLLVQKESTSEERSSAVAQRLGDLMVEVEHLTAVAQDRARLLAAAEQSFHAPLTPIRLQLHLLRNGALGELNERQLAAIERIDRNVRRWWQLQEHLVTDLMGLERQEESEQDMDAADVLAEAMQPFHERAIKAGIRLRVDKDERPMPVRVEQRGLVQAMMLILDHAIRHTPAGGQVWVRLRPIDRDVELVVQDQDPAVEPDTVSRLLTPEADDESNLHSALLHIQSVMHRNSGDLHVHCQGAGRGLEVVLRLPRRSTRNTGAALPGEASHYA